MPIKKRITSYFDAWGWEFERDIPMALVLVWIRVIPFGLWCWLVSRHPIIGVLVAIGVIGALYLLKFFVLYHDTKDELERTEGALKRYQNEVDYWRKAAADWRQEYEKASRPRRYDGP